MQQREIPLAPLRGRPADEDPVERRIRLSEERGLLLTALAVSWGGVLLWPVLWPLDFACGIILLFRRSRLAIPAILLSASFLIPALTFLLTALGYCSGKAVRVGAIQALFDPPTVLDPKYSCHLCPPETCAWPILGLFIPPQQAAIDICYSLIGPMPGTYHGPLPTLEQAAALLKVSGRDATPEEFSALQYEISGSTLEFRRSKEFLSTDYDAGKGRNAAAAGIRVARYDVSCLLVEHPSRTSFGDQGKNVVIEVIDLLTDSVVSRLKEQEPVAGTLT